MFLGKLPPSPKSNANPKPNPDLDWGVNFPPGQFSGHPFSYFFHSYNITSLGKIHPIAI